MPETQKNEPFDTPTHDEIVAWSPLHVELLEQSDDDAVWIAAGMRHVILTHKGRRSGTTRKTPLPYWRDPEGHRIVIASFAGAEHHPAWYHNLADREANPTIIVRERSHIYECAVEILDGDEYTRIWDLVTADRPFYLDYQAGTARRIPVIRLPESD